MCPTQVRCRSLFTERQQSAPPPIGTGPAMDQLSPEIRPAPLRPDSRIISHHLLPAVYTLLLLTHRSRLLRMQLVRGQTTDSHMVVLALATLAPAARSR